MPTITLTRDQRVVIARKLGIDDPDSLTAADLLKLPRSRSSADKAFEEAYLEQLGVKSQVEYEEADGRSRAEQEYNEYARLLNITAAA